jgi:type IV pilus biogenesis protein PilP
MRNSPCLLALVACVLSPAPAWSETIAETLTRLEAETAILKANARKAEVQAQIAGKQAEIANRRAEARRSTPDASSAAPQLRGIEGVGERLYATLELPNRGTVDVRAGDRLPDGTRVVAIKPNEVELETSSRRRIRLAGGMGPTTISPAVHADMSLPPTAMADLPDLPAPRGVRR